MVDAIPFPEDEQHHAYDAAAARRFWLALVQAHRVMARFRGGFMGKESPVHFFWGGADLAVTRFSGRTAPKHPGGVPHCPDWVQELAYSHEVHSCGFWPGGSAEGSFYAYAYPAPAGFADWPVAPEAAFYDHDLGEFLLPYAAVRTADDPDAHAPVVLREHLRGRGDTWRMGPRRARDRAAVSVGTEGGDLVNDTEPVVIVSADSHVGPRLAEELRPYCPSAHLDEFDGLVGQVKTLKENVAGFADFLLKHPNFKTDGHHDSAARLADYDYDGVAAGVIFHASENFEPMPFGPIVPGARPSDDRELRRSACRSTTGGWPTSSPQAPAPPHRPRVPAHVGHRPGRRRGEWAHDHGLKGVNFPALRDGELLEYNNPAWDPFWAACEERNLPLVTHVGASGTAKYEGAECDRDQVVRVRQLLFAPRGVVAHLRAACSSASRA